MGWSGDREKAESQDTGPEKGRRRDARLVATGVITVLLVWFAVANLQDVRVHFWVTTASAPVVAVIAIAGVCGAAIALLVLRRRRRSEP